MNDIKVAAEFRLKIYSGVVFKNIRLRCEKALNLRIALGDEFDNESLADLCHQRGDTSQRNVVSYC